MEPKLPDVLEQVIPRVTSDLLTAYNPKHVGPTPTGPVKRFVATDSECGALTPFVGYGCSGSLLLVAPFQFFAKTYPDKKRAPTLSVSSPGDWILVRDWSGELCNQLLGRIKNALLPHGLTLTSRTPLALSGEPLARTASARTSREVDCSSGSDTIRVWFDVTTARDFRLGERAADASGIPQEGAVIIF